MFIKLRLLDVNGHPYTDWVSGNPDVYTDEWFGSLESLAQDTLTNGGALTIKNIENDPALQVMLVQ